MKTVFLDLDGTLTDPKPGITRSVIHALEALGMEAPPEDALTWVIGPALIDSFAQLGVQDPEAALSLYRERYTDVGLFENRVYVGIPEALAQLRADGFRLVVATAKPHAYATRITAHFGLAGFFDAEFGPELDGTRNDKGELLLHAREVLGMASNERALMIGDRHHDHRAARTASMASLAVTWGFGGAEEHALADATCDSPAQLVDAVHAVCGQLC